MYLTDKQIYDLNNMNVAAQNVNLGELLEALLSNEGGSSSSSIIVYRDSYLLFPNVGNKNNLYIDVTNNTVYRWDSKDLKYYQISYNYTNIREIIGGNANG